MAKVQIKSERITPFGGIFHVREQFSRYVGPVIDKVLGLRCTSFGYQYGEIAGSLASVYFCGGDCVKDVTSHLMPHISLITGSVLLLTKCLTHCELLFNALLRNYVADHVPVLSNMFKYDLSC